MNKKAIPLQYQTLIHSSAELLTTMPSNRADKMRNAAYQEALRSAMRFRHGAIITKGGKILACGHNHIRTGFSGPLTAHQTITLPTERSVRHYDNQTLPHSQSYFSMHAEMHAITSALRGARPNVGYAPPLESMTLNIEQSLANMSVSSRCGDASMGNKTCCNRILVDGAKRERTDVALATEPKWCLKPRHKKGAKEAMLHSIHAGRSDAPMRSMGRYTGGKALALPVACAAS